MRLRSAGFLSAVFGFALATACAGPQPPSIGAQGTPAKGQTRTHYVAADEVDWNYAPTGRDEAMGMPFMGVAREFMEHGPHRIGPIYRKAVYREYTDATFSTVKPRPAEWEHAGILGPIIRAEVGDTISIVFKNNGSRPYSMHPHGVFYQKHSEGATSDDGSSAADKVGGGVPPGQTHTYTWEVPERAGPGPNDPSSLVWLYHSHATELQDVNAGLIGAMVVSRHGMAMPDGRPKDVDHEFVALFMIFDENQSGLLDYNIQHHTEDPKGTEKIKAEVIPVDPEGRATFVSARGFAGLNLRSTINGLQFGNMPMMTMKEGDRVRWYLLTVGIGFNFHTPHWHGNVVMQDGKRTDVLALSPAQMLTVDMVPDDPGTWLFHCHISEHMDEGMMARYQVLPKDR